MVSTPLKNISQDRNLPQIGMKIKNVLKPPPSFPIFLEPQTLDDTLPSPPAIFRPSPLSSQRYFHHAGTADGEEHEGREVIPWRHPGAMVMAEKLLRFYQKSDGESVDELRF